MVVSNFFFVNLFIGVIYDRYVSIKQQGIVPGQPRRAFILRFADKLVLAY